MFNIFGTNRDAGSPLEKIFGSAEESDSSPEPTPSASTESLIPSSQSKDPGFRRWPKWEKVSTPKPLTFGIEFEFNIAFHRYTSDPEPHDPRVIHWPVCEDDYESEVAHHNITNTLRKAGVAAHTFWDLEAEPKVQDWIVADDTSIDAWDKHYEFLPVEVKTPPFYYCKYSRLNVSNVLALLTGTYRLCCNNTTGLHIHVGDAEKGFHPTVLCNLFAVLWTFEERLTMLHSESRRTGRGKDHSRSLRNFSKLGKSLSITPEGTRMGFEKILELRDQDTTQKIIDLMSSGEKSRLAYNVTNLVGNDATLTVEFRQHEGTLSYERTINWLNVCVGLVEFAESVDSDELDKFLWSHIDDNNEEYTVIDLLRAIGRSAEAGFYEKRLLDDN